jgi:hypothetical protein
MKSSAPGAWQHFGAALGSISVDPRDPSHWFFTDWYAAYQTRDAGKHWELSMDGIELTVLHTLAQDPTDPGVVHMGMADNGYLWSETGGDRFQSAKITANMKSIALSPKLPSRIYGVGDGIGGQWSSNQVFISIDRGKTWTKSPMQGLPDTKEFKCNTIAVDPNEPYTVYLAVSKDVAPGKGGVYKSIDGGKSWAWMGQGLPTEGGQFFRDDIWGIGRELTVARYRSHGRHQPRPSCRLPFRQHSGTVAQMRCQSGQPPPFGRRRFADTRPLLLGHQRNRCISQHRQR